MSKKDVAFDKFLADVLATIPEDKRASIEEVFGTDAIKTKLREGVLAREDYSRSMDELTTSRNELAGKIAEANATNKRNVDWYASANQEYSTAREKLTAYEQQYGQIDGTQKKYLTDEDLSAKLDALLTPRDAQSIDVAVMLSEMTSDHRERFKERLNTRELIKFATDNRLSLDVAYDRYVAPKTEALRKTEMDAAIAKAREDGAQDALAKHNLPTIARPMEQYSFDAPTTTPRTQQDRIAAAVAGFRDTAR